MMRKRTWCILLVLVILTSMTLGCSNSGASNPGTPSGGESTAQPTSQGEIGPDAAALAAAAAFGGVTDAANQTYAWCSYESTDDFMLLVYNGFEDCGKMLGVNTVHVGSTINDVTEYINTVEKAINLNADGIAVHVFNADAYIDVINKAVDQGIPVITTGPDSPNSKRSCNIGVENYSAGEFAANKMGEELGGKGKIAIMLRAGQNNSMLRVQGFKDTLAEKYPDMEVITEINVTGEISDQASKTSAALAANPEVNAIFCSLGIQAVGASQACTEMNRDDIVVFGFDLNPTQLERIKEGKVMGTIKQGCYNMGWWACLGLYIQNNDLLQGASFPTYINAGVSYVDQEGIDYEIEQAAQRMQKYAS